MPIDQCHLVPNGGLLGRGTCVSHTSIDAATQCSVHAYPLAPCRLGARSQPTVLGRRNGKPRDQRSSQRCELGLERNERDHIDECPVLQCVRDEYAALFALDNCTTSCGKQFLLGRRVLSRNALPTLNTPF